jgi:hypothetical protein
MSILSKLGLRLPSLKHKAKVWRLTISTEGNDPHVFVCADGRGWDRPVVLSNPIQFVMPENPAFEQTKLNGTDFEGTTVPVYYGEPVPDSQTGDLDIPEYFHGKTIPVVTRDETQVQAWFDGERTELPPPQ